MDTLAQDHIRDQLTALQTLLTGKRYAAEIRHDALVIFTMPANGGPRPALTITCHRRPSDGDRWWFRTGEEWIDQVSHLADAVVWIVGRLAGAPA